MAKALSLSDISFNYGPDRPVLKDFSLSIPEGQFLSLLGPSGCGKSTLLRLFAGLLAPDAGEVLTPSADRSIVFQEPRLLPWRNVRENIELPLELRGGLNEKSSTRLRELMEQVGVSGFQDLFPHQLSGGMRQRTAIARALITEPRVLFLDEPFSALDEATREDLQELLRALWKERGMTVVFVTHSIPEAVFLSERITALSARGGQILRDEMLSSSWERSADFRTGPELNRTVAEFSRALRGQGKPS